MMQPGTMQPGMMQPGMLQLIKVRKTKRREFDREPANVYEDYKVPSKASRHMSQLTTLARVSS
jgi:hypothetical protein